LGVVVVFLNTQHYLHTQLLLKWIFPNHTQIMHKLFSILFKYKITIQMCFNLYGNEKLQIKIKIRYNIVYFNPNNEVKDP